MEGAREIRSTALRLLASLWSRFPQGADYNPLWPRFFSVAEPIMQRLAIEVGLHTCQSGIDFCEQQAQNA